MLPLPFAAFVSSSSSSSFPFPLSFDSSSSSVPSSSSSSSLGFLSASSTAPTTAVFPVAARPYTNTAGHAVCPAPHAGSNLSAA